MPVVKVVAVINQKGGVGKTTTVANLGAAVASKGRNVCLIDLDPQSQLTLHFGADTSGQNTTIYDVLTRGRALDDAVCDLGEHLSLVPSEIDLAAAEMEMVSTVGREQILADRLAVMRRACDVALIDCHPSLGVLTLNALAAADELIIPLQAHFLALQGLSRLLETVSLVQQRINPRLHVGGLVLCMFERNTRLAGEVVADLGAFLDAARGTDVPWADAHVFRTAIRRNVKLAECPSYGKSIFDYEPSSHGAEDYAGLADEFLLSISEPVESPMPQTAVADEADTPLESDEAPDAEVPAPPVPMDAPHNTDAAPSAPCETIPEPTVPPTPSEQDQAPSPPESAPSEPR